MKKILFFVANILACIGFADAAVRDVNAVSRQKNGAQNQVVQSRAASSTGRVATRENAVVSRADNQRTGKGVTARSASNATPSRGVGGQSVTRVATGGGRTRNVVSARATNTTSVMSSTRVGAEYERCKNTYFSCMDQFCSLKNDDYRRCSCNNRVFQLAELRDTLQAAGEQLNVFTENLDVVGMTAEQAIAMKTETEGEAALTDDKSASKALLQAIMNSIRGEEVSVGGKFADLNSVNLSFDTVNAFGMTDVGQAIAGYNGVSLYNAVYPQCRDAVRADCNDAALQRAVTAYLMAIEQDCNTVQNAIENTQAKMKAAVRESNAMLDLARVENRQQHNTSSVPACINEIEDAILSEEVCGANYHKCLDNGEYVDVSTGKPISGVSDFFKLGSLLQFSQGIDASYQKLAQNPSNRTFVQNFESRVKKFAADALDKCVENADVAWTEYLNKAMLSIYYAQQDKVSEVKQTCFDYISDCYGDAAGVIDSAISGLADDNAVILQPDKIALSSRVCSDYIESCNNMFDGDIIAEYLNQVKDADTVTACRAIVQQCFDKFGGNNYENFYYPYSGLFEVGQAADWFTLYESDANGAKTYKSECAKQLAGIAACNKPDVVERAFGGFVVADENNNVVRTLLPSGVATEVYNNILDILSVQCVNLNGRFMAKNHENIDNYGQSSKGLCYYAPQEQAKKYYYVPEGGENMCPRNYELGVDIESWGICSCWENGGRRSKFGTETKCVAVLPTAEEVKEGVTV